MSAVRLAVVDSSRCQETQTIAGPESGVEHVQLGHIEEVTGKLLTGWVVDSHCTDAVTFQIYESNKLILEGEANTIRSDLSEAGYTAGAFGFEAELPQSLAEGAEHTLKLRIENNDHVLSERPFTIPPFARSSIAHIDGAVVSGSVVLAEKHEADGFNIELLIDDKVVSEATCSRQQPRTEYEFSIGVPQEYLDDSCHVFQVRLKGLLTVSEPHVETLPSILTPWTYLAKGAPGHLLSRLPKVAGHRYIGLQKHIAAVSSGATDASELSNIKLAHDVLVEGYENRSYFPVLKLAKVAKPKVSIVLPVHNKFSLTYNCIASLILCGDASSIEVIVVDDKSADETCDIESIVENVIYVRNDINQGFLLSSKRGANVASGEYIVFLNNDTEVTSNWLDEMINVFDQYEDVGAVGSKLIYPSGRLQEAGGIVWGSGKPWNIGNGQNAEHPKFNYTRQVDYLSGASLMVSRRVWDEIGGFSEELVPAYYEDTDLAFKVRDAGYRTIYCPFSTVIHFEGMSNGRDVNVGVKKFQNVNAPKFRRKWRHAFSGNGQEGKQLNLQMDRNVDFRALVVDYTTPRPDQDAGGYAAVQEIKLLQELGCKVTFVPNNQAHMGVYTEALQRQGVECIYAPFYFSVGEFLKERGSEFDLVYITRYDIAEQVIESVRQFTDARIVFNNADLHFLRELRAALAAGDASLEAPVETRDRELKVMREVDAILSYNEVEHAVIASHNLNEENVFKCPWVLESRRSLVPFEERSGLAFLGGFRHLPNREAVKYFVSSVMPLLRIAQPGIRFHIYGSHITEDIRSLASDDVIVEGFVEKLSDVFDQCRVFVAPLLSGAGIKGKVLESIAHGVPTVLTPIAAEATGLAQGHSTRIANTPEQWCDFITEIYNSEETWNRISENAHALVNQQYSFANGIERMKAVLNYIELEPAEIREALFSVRPSDQ